MESPNKPQAKAPSLERADEYAKGLVNECSRTQDPEEGQEYARKLDSLLKDVSGLQSNLGEYRRQMSKHLSKLRKSSPRAKKQGGGYTSVELVVGNVYDHNGLLHRWDGEKLILIPISDGKEEES